MADRKINAQGEKGRIFQVLGGTVVGVAVLVGLYYGLKSSDAFGSEDTKSSLSSSVPSIQSNPGVGNPTEAYARLIQEQNTQKAEQALQSGGSSVPTIINADVTGDPNRFLDAYRSAMKDRQDAARDANLCSPENLARAREAGVTALELRCNGCSAKELMQAGYSAAELRAAGFDAAQLKAAGFSAADLKAAGFSAAELRKAGFSASEMLAAGYSAAELKAAGFSAKELLDAGMTAAQLKAAGFSASELKAAGVSAKALLAAGFSAAQLRDAAFQQKSY